MSVLVGVRTTIADRVEALNFTRKEEGTYTSKGPSKTKMRAYTRLLVAKISLKHNVGFIGKELRVAVCHLHFQVANNNQGFRKKNQEFRPWLAAEIKQYGVHVRMGDFNMALFRVVPELRSHGIEAILVSWFPWRAEETHEIMVD